MARLARMVGRDAADLSPAEWRDVACWFSEQQLRMVHDAAFRVAGNLADDTPIVGAGTGRWQIRRLAARMERRFIDFADIIPADDAVRSEASSAAPAAAVALLAGMQAEPRSAKPTHRNGFRPRGVGPPKPNFGGIDMNSRILALTLAGGLSAAPAFAQDDGQTAFNNNCRTCHTMKEGDNRQGPSLAGIIGRKAGSLPDYDFSASMKQSGIVWDEANLDQFIANPDQVVSGNTMKPYGGITDAALRKTIVGVPETGGLGLRVGLLRRA